MSQNNTDEKKPLKWWLQVAVAILSALIGILAEAKTDVAASLFNI
jgi:hypothetical protein